ncbi:MAG: hypothetical protein PHY04_03090 [Candidatus ainarchaeum sp.]|nr:hypothetical protein [Candidatus ainarchaeum sp.]MDD4128694.1 hypothetical protein [Candidatus ainarchaeum sp.]HPM85879.1 hypothetical protein [archaeon]
MNDEEVAFRIVRLYFEEIARLGFKRTLDLDQMIDAYFYTLKKLSGKEEAVKKASKDFQGSEKDNLKESKLVESSTTQINSSNEVITKNPQNSEKTITQIVEEN